ncbi:condensation domain-containing protein, partial [Virgisporangium aurantiacum]|uniref:condensation domain-containing protein n=1 Tax=Virgisporangium aurantiacum TaxID=175570 RepID=UPI001EF39A12
MRLYQAHLDGTTPDLPHRPPYRNYLTWLANHDTTNTETYWRHTLTNITEPTPLPTTTNPQPGHTETRRELPTNLTTQLTQLARQHHLTLSTIIRGAWAILLHHYSNHNHILFGATVSGRPPDLPGVENIIGLFINTIPITADLTTNPTILELLTTLQTQHINHTPHQHTPLTDIHTYSNIPTGTPLFNTIIVYENYPAG